MSRHPSVIIERAVSVPMSDGISLCADIYRPRNFEIPLPVLLMRLPYGREVASTVVYAHPSWYATHGFIVVIQDVRGCGRSEGTFYPLQTAEISDGVDSINWCRQLPGSNGKVGMYGFSYQGITQFQAVAGGATSAGLVAIAPGMAAIDRFRGWCYWGGALALDVVLPWSLQLAQDRAQFKAQEPDATELGEARSQIGRWLEFTPLDRLAPLANKSYGKFYFDWVREAIADSPYDIKLNPKQRLQGTYDLPGLHIAGWADSYLLGTLQAYEWLVNQTQHPQHLIVGPWQHIPWSRRVGEMDFGPDASPQIDRLQVQWFNRWLREDSDSTGKPQPTTSFKSTTTPQQESEIVLTDETPVQLFEMGSNRWIQFKSWPVPTTPKTLWLSSQGLANGPDSDGKLVDSPDEIADVEFDTYVYDPRIANPTTPYGPYVQQSVHQRPDLVLYTSEAFETPLAILGAPRFHLYAATTGLDTDWVVKLMRISDSGQALLLTAGVLRARFRNSLSEPEELTPDRILDFTIDLRPTCWRIQAGERLQIAIASSAFPWIDRNPNTGQCPATAQFSDFQMATQTIFHFHQWPSRLVLPVRQQ
ncbi:MAG: CocE/NonD family hydrolase [Synechococcus sp.]